MPYMPYMAYWPYMPPRFLATPHRMATTRMISAARDEMCRFHNHHSPTRGAPMARPGFSQKASAR